MGSIFAGTSNVRVYGGSFKVVNGPYCHHDHQTHHHNHNSTNVSGNRFADAFNDHSSTFLRGSVCSQAPKLPRQQRRAHTMYGQSQQHDIYSSFPPTNEQPPSRSRARSQNPSEPSSNASSSPEQLFQSPRSMSGLHVHNNPSNIQTMDPNTVYYFERLMETSHSNNDSPEAEDRIRGTGLAKRKSRGNELGLDDGQGDDDQTRYHLPPVGHIDSLFFNDPSLSLYQGAAQHARPPGHVPTNTPSPNSQAVPASQSQHHYLRTSAVGVTSNVAHRLENAPQATASAAQMPDQSFGNTPPASSSSALYNMIPGTGYGSMVSPHCFVPTPERGRDVGTPAEPYHHPSTTGSFAEIRQGIFPHNFGMPSVVQNNIVQTFRSVRHAGAEEDNDEYVTEESVGIVIKDVIVPGNVAEDRP